MPESRIRLTVLGGYLGSGKTTWLRHQLRHDPSPPHVIVNEAAEMPVDDLLLRDAAGLTVLAGGCACCTGSEALIAALRQLCDGRARNGLDRIVLETSGLADPGAITAAIRADPVLVHHVLVTETIVVVDALNALVQLASDALGRAQIAAADRFVVTKTDIAEPAGLVTLLATLAALNPGAAIGGAVAGLECALPPVPLGTESAVLPELAADRPTITAEKLTLAAEVDWAVLSLWLSALLHARGDDLVRVKGVVRTPAGRLLIQTVRKVVQSPEVLPELALVQDDCLVFIGHGCTADQLGRSLAWFGRAG